MNKAYDELWILMLRRRILAATIIVWLRRDGKDVVDDLRKSWKDKQ